LGQHRLAVVLQNGAIEKLAMADLQHGHTSGEGLQNNVKPQEEYQDTQS
jgi:hypothetical protein